MIRSSNSARQLKRLESVEEQEIPGQFCLVPAWIFLERKCIDLSALHRSFHKQDSKEKENYKKAQSSCSSAFRDPFVTAAEAASQSSSGTRANLHKVEAAEEGLFLGELAEYTASQAHWSTPVPTTHPSIPPPATRAVVGCRGAGEP